MLDWLSEAAAAGNTLAAIHIGAGLDNHEHCEICFQIFKLNHALDTMRWEKINGGTVIAVVQKGDTFTPILQA